MKQLLRPPQIRMNQMKHGMIRVIHFERRFARARKTAPEGGNDTDDTCETRISGGLLVLHWCSGLPARCGAAPKRNTPCQVCN